MLPEPPREISKIFYRMMDKNEEILAADRAKMQKQIWNFLVEGRHKSDAKFSNVQAKMGGLVKNLESTSRELEHYKEENGKLTESIHTLHGNFCDELKVAQSALEKCKTQVAECELKRLYDVAEIDIELDEVKSELAELKENNRTAHQRRSLVYIQRRVYNKCKFDMENIIEAKENKIKNLERRIECFQNAAEITGAKREHMFRDQSKC